MENLHLKTLAVALSLLLVACGGGGGAVATISPSPTVSLTPQQQIAALEANGALPKLDRSMSLAGPDVDANGVRDDVDAYIAANYTAHAQRAAVRQMAATFQAKLIVDLADSKAVYVLSKRNMAAINCVFDKFEELNGTSSPEVVINDIKSITANTKPRLLRYLAFSKQLNGTTMTLPQGDTCE